VVFGRTVFQLQIGSIKGWNYIHDEYRDPPSHQRKSILHSFKSNFGEIDTIFIFEKDTIFGYPEAQKFNGIMTQQIQVSASLSNNSEKGGLQDELGRFFVLSRNQNNQTSIRVGLMTEDFWFYQTKNILLEDLINAGFIDFKIGCRRYDDVVVLSGDRGYSSRENFIDMLYWSKSKGLVRYEKTDGECWDLVEVD
jgi:hypothetical protein